MSADARERLERVKKALETNPDDWALLDEKLDALVALNRYRDGLEVTDRMLEIWPNGAGAHYNRGYILRLLDRLEDAEVITRDRIKTRFRAGLRRIVQRVLGTR